MITEDDYYDSAPDMADSIEDAKCQLVQDIADWIRELGCEGGGMIDHESLALSILKRFPEP